jgi:hypothetical protein
MPSPNSVFTELVTTTFRKHRKEIVDNLSNRNALLKYLMKRGNYRTEDGGLSIAIPFDYAANSTYQRYSDWDTLNIGQSEVLSAAEYQWRQIAIHVVASGRELRINSGETRIINLVKARMKNAIRTFNNNFSFDLYSNGTLTNQINGIQALIADTPTNTVGGIDAGTWTFWQNKVYSASDNGVTPSATTIENSLLLPAWMMVDRGPDDQPDLIVMSNDWYQFFEQSQTSIKRYTSQQNVAGGLISLKYKTADVFFDGNSGIPPSRAYLINTEYLYLVVHEQANLEVLDAQKPVNQDGEIVPIIFMGNLCCSNRSMQCVIKP